jgi:signal transduction histidine kinase
VKHLIEAHKGEVKVESKVGEGSTFTFLIPKELSLEEGEEGSKGAMAGPRS